MQPDPLGLGAADVSDPQSLNLYSYVQNDPINFVDPEGLNLMDPDYWEKNQTLFGGYGNGGSGRGIFSPGIHSYGYWSQVSMSDVSGTYYFPAQYYTGTLVMGGSVGYTGGGMTYSGSGGGGINSPSVNGEILSRLGTKLKKLIPSVCGGSGFGYGGVGVGAGPVHAEALALVQYDSQEGGSHGGLLGAGAGHYTLGGEAMRTWRDWQEHISPIALGGIEVKGATRVFGKKLSTESRDIGGLVQYENGQLSLGLYGGITLASHRTFGGGVYVTLSWRGCHE